MLKKIALFVVVLLAGLLGYASTRPAEFHVERSISIHAPPEKIYPLVSDFHSWNDWSPFEKLDPAMQKTYTGAPNGVGAAYAWSGNGQAGAGSMEITEAEPNEHLVIRIAFTKPFAAQNTVDFKFVPAGENTMVTWSMSGPSPLLSRVIGIVMDMDSLIGKDFENGLGALKGLSEKATL